MKHYFVHFHLMHFSLCHILANLPLLIHTRLHDAQTVGSKSCWKPFLYTPYIFISALQIAEYGMSQEQIHLENSDESVFSPPKSLSREFFKMSALRHSQMYIGTLDSPSPLFSQKLQKFSTTATMTCLIANKARS